MGDFERAFALMDQLDEEIAERVDPTPHGELIVSTRLNNVYDENFLRVRDPGDATAAELAAEAEEAQGRYPEIRHRRVNVRGAETGARLEPEFLELGWRAERFVLMTLREAPSRSPDTPVREVDAAQLRGPWAEAGRSFGGSDELIAQMVEHHTAIAHALPTRHFAVEAEGRIAAYCELYSADGIGQVENVVTLPEFRRRGYATSLVLHATAESLAMSNDLTFLVADADDWPHTLYERLGFEIAGRYARFLKPG